MPLAELAIVIGFLAMAAAFALGNVSAAIASFVLMLLGVLEFTWREHRHGYRSHGAVLGGVIGIATGVILWRIVGVDSRNLCAVIGLVTFIALWSLLSWRYTPREARAPSAQSSEDD